MLVIVLGTVPRVRLVVVVVVAMGVLVLAVALDAVVTVGRRSLPRSLVPSQIIVLRISWLRLVFPPLAASASVYVSRPPIDILRSLNPLLVPWMPPRQAPTSTSEPVPARTVSSVVVLPTSGPVVAGITAPGLSPPHVVTPPADVATVDCDIALRGRALPTRDMWKVGLGSLFPKRANSSSVFPRSSAPVGRAIDGILKQADLRSIDRSRGIWVPGCHLPACGLLHGHVDFRHSRATLLYTHLADPFDLVELAGKIANLGQDISCILLKALVKHFNKIVTGHAYRFTPVSWGY